MPRWLGTALRLVGTAAGLAWIATQVELREAGHALGRISPAVFAIATALVAANVVVAAARWRVLLGAYGATRVPRFARLAYLYFVAFFYNNYLPGAVAGDVGRGVVTRDAFEGEGAAGALAVVLVERALGLFGLFALLGAGLATAGRALETGALAAWTAIGCAGSCALVAMIPLARRLAPQLPGPLGRIAARLPALRSLRAFALALALSVATQALVVLAGWVLLDALAGTGLAASLLIVPLAAATTFLPITVGGAGAREAVYVALGGRLLGMPEADALAASLGLWLAHLAVGAAGGGLQLARRGMLRGMSERVTLEPIGHVRVSAAGQVVAETTRGYVVHETGLPDRYYVPREDIRAELSDGTGAGTCPWKGLWKHLDVRISDTTVSNGAWTYYETKPVTDAMRDFVAFYENKFEIRTR